DFDVVWAAAQDVGARGGGAAALSTLVAYAMVVSFELMSATHLDVKLPRRAVARTSFISYAFNFNLGAAIGGIGLRLRLYRRLGLSKTQVMQLVLGCMITCWVGYALLAGLLFAVAPP